MTRQACDATRFLAEGACVKNVDCKGGRVTRKGVKLADVCDCSDAGAKCQSCALAKVTDTATGCLSVRVSSVVPNICWSMAYSLLYLFLYAATP